ncbi:MAG: DUF3108 domain-containing protein [Proteobacteria bacterium]|nr:DUF3108 domain-containing protein [Pseudomonadota bacterium]
MKKFLATALLALAVPCMSANAAATLKPFTANYQMARSGDVIGDATFSLRPAAGGWEYDQTTRGTHGVAALAAANVEESSLLQDTDGVLQLRSYRYRMSTLLKSSNRSVDVDPATRSIVIRNKKREQSFPFQAGVLDQNSVTLAIARDLADGKRGTLSYPVATRSSVEIQRYVVGKEQMLTVPAGSLRTLVVTRQRDTPNGRVTAYWFGMDNGYVPVRIVQNEPNGESWQASLVSVVR